MHRLRTSHGGGSRGTGPEQAEYRALALAACAGRHGHRWQTAPPFPKAPIR